MKYINHIEEQNTKLREAMEWISVKDRLPQEDDRVLVFTGNYDGIMQALYLDDLMLFIDEYSGGFDAIDKTITNHVTHWMELPKPPKK